MYTGTKPKVKKNPLVTDNESTPLIPNIVESNATNTNSPSELLPKHVLQRTPVLQFTNQVPNEGIRFATRSNLQYVKVPDYEDIPRKTKTSIFQSLKNSINKN